MTVQELNALPQPDAIAELMRCCGSTTWATAMAKARPFASREAVLQAADRLWAQSSEADWREAMTHHPRIGDVSKLREKYKATADWSSQEQKGVAGVDEQTLQALAQGNRDYEARYGFIFLVCATGKTAAEMLQLLRARMNHTAADELKIAAGEQAKITRIRLEKLLP